MPDLDAKRVMETGVAILAVTAIVEGVRWLYRHRRGAGGGIGEQRA